MPQANSSRHPHTNQMIKRIFIGAGIGVLAISFFLIPSEAKPEWGQFWMIRPLIVTPLAGAMGGFCNHIILNYYDRAGINKTIALVLSILVPIVGLFLGIVLGLDTTMWD